MYYRRKVLLALLEALDREVLRTTFQKYLFLVSVEQEKPAYDFVPYRYGCFSFQAEADKKTLTKYGLLEDRKNWMLGQHKRFLHLLEPVDKEAICAMVDRFGNLPGRELIRHVYREHPYYAINSETRYGILSQRELDRVDSARPAADTAAHLFTIGYEGLSLERYLNRLVKENVGALCDVRRNPVSMKFGFSKSPLQNAVQGLGIAYVPMPELGIASNKRRELNSPGGYQALFKEYADTTLAQNDDALRRIVDLIKTSRRVALTCFEADHESCHRSRIVAALTQRGDFQCRVAHLRG